jgi:hypothetical protein
MVDMYAARYGFQTAFVMAGNAIHQDYGLAEVYTTSGANNVSHLIMTHYVSNSVK